MERIKVVLAGQPNVGKSMLINALSGTTKGKVGNFSGVTVEKLEVCFTHHCHLIELIDLPGTYSLDAYSKEEMVAKEYLLNEEYDLILNVVDSTNLQRNLLLTLELLELNKKMIVALNFADEAKRDGVEIDIKQLQKLLGVRVVLISAKENRGIKELLDAIHYVAEHKREPNRITYSDVFEEEILKLEKFLNEKGFRYKDWSNREVAIALLFENEKVYKDLHDNPIMIELYPLIRDSLEHIYTHYETKDIKEIKASEHAAIARGIVLEVVKGAKEPKSLTLTQKIDSILLHKYLGIPIFLFFMWALFQLTFKFGNIPMEYIKEAIDGFSNIVGGYISNSEIRSLVVDGIIGGVGAVLLFLPNIIILYLGIALLETTGYMSRVAFLLDGFFHKFGLHGKSFIPLVTGFGCSVPAYMAARVLKSKTDRLITLFIIGFMSCGARLPIYVLFIGAFFPQEIAGNMLFLIYIFGAIVALVMAKFLRVFIFKSEDEPFVMEMPKYRLPSLRLLWHSVYSNAKEYLKKAGTFILAAAVLVWFASNYPKDKELDQTYLQKIETTKSEKRKKELEVELKRAQLENSYLGQIGKATAPFFAPLGFDWKLSVALISGLGAKEIVVSTLGVLYSVEESKSDLKEALRKNLTLPVAMSFIVFVIFYLPCFAASSMFTKEAGGVKYFIYLFLFTTAVAWIMSFLIFNLVKLFV
ncbi:MAG: ferrous iron transport protein B [Epsilonproteobacteria bacterium]|nr:ferrous iron transport protein B [Campylobacterota bacterium]